MRNVKQQTMKVESIHGVINNSASLVIPACQESFFNKGLSADAINTNRGFVMVAALLVLLTLSVMGIMMINTATLETKISGVEKEDAQALFLAEAGVAQVKTWIQDPDTFSPLTDGFSAALINTPASQGGVGFVDCTGVDASSVASMVAGCTNFPNLTAANEGNFFRRRLVNVIADKSEYTRTNNDAGGSGLRRLSQFADVNGNNAQDARNRQDDAGNEAPALRITDPLYLDSLFGDFSDDIGRITSIEIYPPMADYSRPFGICTVRVTAETLTGYTKTIEVEVRESNYLPINAGAEAGMGGAFTGNVSVNWGDLLAIGNVQLNKPNTPKRCNGAVVDPNGDRWFKARVEGCVTDNQGNCVAPDNTCPATPDCIGCDGADGDPVQRVWQEYAVYHNQGAGSVTLDRWDTNKIKADSLDYGYYYKINPANPGQVYKSNSNGDLLGNPIDVKALLLDPNRPQTLFVDTRDGLGNKRKLEVKVTSGDFYTVGDLFVDGDLELSGGAKGGIPAEATRPDGSAANLSDINFYGVVYTTGDLSGQGSPKVFGGIIAEGSMNHGGTPTVWYDIALKEGRPSQPKTGKGRWREMM